MKCKTMSSLALAATLLVGQNLAGAADAAKKEKAKPYTLKTCIVSDEKLGEMGEAYVFTHEGQEIKLCCKSCKKDFDKNPKKYLKKLEAPKKKS